MQVDVSRANKLVDQLHAALEQAKQAGNQGSAELIASLQAELERQAGIIGELRAQLRASSDAQEELRRQTVSLVEAQAQMAAEQRNVVDGPPVVVAMLHAQLLEKVYTTCRIDRAKIIGARHRKVHSFMLASLRGPTCIPHGPCM